VSARVVEREVSVFERDVPPTGIVRKILDILAQPDFVSNQDPTVLVFLRRVTNHFPRRGERSAAEFEVFSFSHHDVHALSDRVVWRGDAQLRICDVAYTIRHTSAVFGPDVSVTVGMVVL